jgi:ribosomal protein S18 acetylase RimI-like enzyme
MNVHEWRVCSATGIAPLYDAEVARWMATLHWDTRASWIIVEAARAAGSLPGFVVCDDDGSIRGWTFYLRHEGALQVGAFVADAPETTAALLDAITASPDAVSASAIIFFTFSVAPGLTAQLKECGLAVERYRYLQTSLGTRAGLKACPTTGDSVAPDADDVAQAFRPATWRSDDHHAVAALLTSAYPSHDPARPFARSGQAHEWVDYVHQVVATGGCGTFLPHASLVVPGVSPDCAGAAVLVTSLSYDTVHLAQVAVSPGARGHGLARRLIADSLAAAGDAGYTRATLLVGERNVAARHVYDQLGFEEVAAFVSAACDQPRRSSSAAFESGGAITRR